MIAVTCATTCITTIILIKLYIQSRDIHTDVDKNVMHARPQHHSPSTQSLAESIPHAYVSWLVPFVSNPLTSLFQS